MLYIVLLGVLSLIIIGVIVHNKRTVKENAPVTVKKNATVIMEDDNITIIWENHKIVFEFSKEDDMINYHGARCDDSYSASVASYPHGNLPWKLWAKCGNDEITILTDLKHDYKIL